MYSLSGFGVVMVWQSGGHVAVEQWSGGGVVAEWWWSGGGVAVAWWLRSRVADTWRQSGGGMVSRSRVADM